MWFKFIAQFCWSVQLFFPVPSAEVDSKRKKKVQQECVSLIAQQPDSQTSEVVRAPFRFPTPDVWESGYTTNQHKIVWFNKMKSQVRETTAVSSIFLPPSPHPDYDGFAAKHKRAKEGSE